MHNIHPKSGVIQGIYLIHTTHGRITVRAGGSLSATRAAAKREFGTLYFIDAQSATLNDLAYIKSAGGWLPESIRPQVEAHEKLITTIIKE